METTGNERQLRERVAELELERSELERELARLRGELDMTRAALPEIEDLHTHLQKLRDDYAARSEALQMLIAAAAREIGERTGVGPPPRPAPVTPRRPERERRPKIEEPRSADPPRHPEAGPALRPGSDDAATDEVETADPSRDPAGSEDASGGPAGRSVWQPDVDEPVRGDWSTEQPRDGRRA